MTDSTCKLKRYNKNGKIRSTRKKTMKKLPANILIHDLLINNHYHQ